MMFSGEPTVGRIELQLRQMLANICSVSNRNLVLNYDKVAQTFKRLSFQLRALRDLVDSLPETTLVDVKVKEERLPKVAETIAYLEKESPRNYVVWVATINELLELIERIQAIQKAHKEKEHSKNSQLRKQKQHLDSLRGRDKGAPRLSDFEIQ